MFDPPKKHESHLINGSLHVQRVRFIDPHLSWKPPPNRTREKNPNRSLSQERIQQQAAGFHILEEIADTVDFFRNPKDFQPPALDV